VRLSDKWLESSGDAPSVGRTSDKVASSARFAPLAEPHAEADSDFSNSLSFPETNIREIASVGAGKQVFALFTLAQA